MKNVFAVTEIGHQFPAYLSINRDKDGSYLATVRSQGNDGRDRGTIRLTQDALKRMAADVLAEIDSDQAQPSTCARVTPDMITAAIVRADYHVLPGTQITVCTITLRNGTKVLGYNYGAIDPARQDWQQGRQAAYDMAREKIWELEGYAQRERLASTPVISLHGQYSEEDFDKFKAYWQKMMDAAKQPQPRVPVKSKVTHVVTDEMVSRFLSWKLPNDFAPDGGISFKESAWWPTGTNLLTADQARAMLQHVLGEEA